MFGVSTHRKLQKEVLYYYLAIWYNQLKYKVKSNNMNTIVNCMAHLYHGSS